MPGNKHFKLEEISHTFPTLKICQGVAWTGDQAELRKST